MARIVDKLAKLVVWENGLRVRGTPLWLDARRPRELCFVSHAHGDHRPAFENHLRTLATPLTLELIGAAGAPGAMPCSFRRPFSLGELRLELLPSGHFPGAAQLLVEVGATRLLYTGDIYDQPQNYAEPLELTHCDLLLLDATYGTVHHRFPTRRQAAAQLRAEVSDALERGDTPLVLIEGSVGRTQEVLAELSELGRPLVVSKAINRWCRRYRALGLEVPRCRPYGGRPERGSVLVYPMRARGLTGLNRIRGLYKVACSGQMAKPGGSLRGLARRLGVDAVVPFVDHVDFEGLMAVIDACAPKLVGTLFGHAEDLAGALRARDIKAVPIGPGAQQWLDV